MTHDVYICHSSEDSTIASAICTSLEQNHIRCWIAPRDLAPGSAFVQSITEAISTARLTVLVLSDSSNSSRQVWREIEHSAGQDVPVLLFRVEDVVASPALEQFISGGLQLDAMTAPLDQHLDRLVETVHRGLGRESPRDGTEPVSSPAPARSSASSPTPRASEQGRDVPRTRTFRVFVSSTFRDLEAERNHLREHVYEDLRALCAAHGARFQAIDLRWGVSREASLDQQAMNVCLEEIDRCREVTPRPNFVVLLGNRHGWLAPPPQIPAEELDKLLEHVRRHEDKDLLTGPEGWYRRDDNADPPEFYLRPREGEYEDDVAWGPVEARLHAILADAAGETGYQHDPKYTASATEQEILHGALGVGAPEGRAFCFVRNLTGDHPDPAKANKGAAILDFVDPDQAPLMELKRALHSELPYTEYEARWDPEAERPTTDHLEDLARDVREALTAAILEEIEHPAPVSGGAPTVERVAADRALDDEGRAHRAFAEDRCRVFVGREDELATIAAYLRDDDTRPLVIAGAGGTGKSALLAEALRRAQHDHDRVNVVHRFIGATAASSDVRALLLGLCQELARRAGTEDSAIPADYQELVSDLRERLLSVGSEGPLLVFLDSLDQLSPTHGARGLGWLPMVLPAGVRLVVSTRPGDTLAPLERRGAPVTHLGPMTPGDGAELFGRWLEEHHRTLQPEQSDEVLARFAGSEGNPLYLRLAFEETRRWRSDQQADEREHLATGVQGIIAANTFGRLAKEENHGDVLVSHALGYLTASRYGLAEDELLDVLSRDPEVYAWFLRSAHDVPPDLRERAHEYRKPTTDDELTRWLDEIRTGSQDQEHSELRAFLGQVLPRQNGPRLPVVLWSRLFFDLRPYLTERDADGSTLITFFHRELEDTACREFLGERAPDYHARLADYFTPAGGDDDRPNWAAASLRGLSELPYHLIEAQRWDDVEETLTDFAFLEAKASRVAVDRHTDQDGNEVVTYAGVGRLQDDFDLALRELSGGEETDRPRIIVTATDLGDGFVVRCPHCNVIHVFGGVCAPCHASHDLDDWLGQEITCPNKKCQEPLRVNEFTAGGGGQRLRGVSTTPRAPSPAASGSVGDAVPATLPSRSQELLAAFAAALLREQHTLRAQPWLCFQQLHNRLQWDDDPVPDLLDTALARHGTDTGSAPWLRTRWAFREAQALRRTLTGHFGPVNGCAVTPDGRRVISASRDQTLKVWDLETGAETATLTGHTGPVNGCAVTPDGRRVISASDDQTLKVWDLETGAETAALTGHTDHVMGCAVSPDGRRVVSASDDGTLKVWDLETGTETATHGGYSKGLAISPDGRWVASHGTVPAHGARDSGIPLVSDALIVWDLETGVEIASIYGHEPSVWGCAVSPDGRDIFYPKSMHIWVWEFESGTDTPALPSYSPAVRACAVSPDGRRVASASKGHTLKVWNLETGETATEAATLTGHTDHVNGCAVSPDGRLVVSASQDHTLKIWDLETATETATPTGHTEPVEGCAISPDGRRVVSASDDGTLKVWDLETGTETATLSGHEGLVLGCAVSPDGRRVVSASQDTRLKVWDLENGWETATLHDERGWVWGCAVSPDSRWVVSAGTTLSLWDLEIPNPERQSAVVLAGAGGGSYVTSCAVSPDGRHIVAAHEDGTLSVLDRSTSTETETPPTTLTATLTGHTGRVNACAVSPDGRRVVSASWDGTLKVWDLETGTETATLTGHSSLVRGCAISPDGRRVISASDDHTLKVWDLETGTELASLPLAGEVLSVAAHPARPLVACGDSGGGVMVVELIGIEYGPLVVTAIDHGHGPVLCCPTCQSEHPLDESWLGQDIHCPADCNTRLSVNPFIADTQPTAAPAASTPWLYVPDRPPPDSPRRGMRALLRRRPKR